MASSKFFLPALGLLSVCTQLFLFPKAAYSVRGLMICNVEGTAQLLPNGDSTAAVNAERNVFLANETALLTSSNGFVRVGIDEFLGRVDVLDDTNLGIADMVRDMSSNATRLVLNEGSVHVSFYRSHVDPDSVFMIQTPTAILTVIGNFLPPDMPLTTQDNRSELFSYVKSDNRQAFCSDPVDLFEIENFDAWEPAVSVAFNTDTVNAGQTLDNIGNNKNIPNFLVTVDSDGTTEVQVDSGMLFVERRPVGNGVVSEASYSDENIYDRILAALSRGMFDDSVGMVAGPGVEIIVAPE